MKPIKENEKISQREIELVMGLLGGFLGMIGFFNLYPFILRAEIAIPFVISLILVTMGATLLSTKWKAIGLVFVIAVPFFPLLWNLDSILFQWNRWPGIKELLILLIAPLLGITGAALTKNQSKTGSWVLLIASILQLLPPLMLFIELDNLRIGRIVLFFLAGIIFLIAGLRGVKKVIRK